MSRRPLTRNERQLRQRAYGAVIKAIRIGRIVKPGGCEVCGDPECLSAHHHRGYEDAVALDVRWLCRSHHGEAHVIEGLRPRAEARRIRGTLPKPPDGPYTPLRTLRLTTGLTLREVSRRTGINSGRLSIIERGVTPTEAEARAIRETLIGPALEQQASA